MPPNCLYSMLSFCKVTNLSTRLQDGGLAAGLAVRILVPLFHGKESGSIYTYSGGNLCGGGAYYLLFSRQARLDRAVAGGHPGRAAGIPVVYSRRDHAGGECGVVIGVVVDQEDWVKVSIRNFRMCMCLMPSYVFPEN